jgi:hypothetical protein
MNLVSLDKRHHSALRLDIPGNVPLRRGEAGAPGEPATIYAAVGPRSKLITLKIIVTLTPSLESGSKTFS